MLVITGIVAFALGLLVPVIQQMRAAALRTQCQDNLRRIGLALHEYHGVHDRFPPGVVMAESVPAGAPPPGGYSTSFLPPATGALSFLLPYVGREDLFKQIPPDFLDPQCTRAPWAYSTPPFDTQNGNNTGLPAWAMPHCEVFECPAAANRAPINRTETDHYGVIDAFFSGSAAEGPLRAGVPAIIPNPGGSAPTASYTDWVPPTTPGFSGPDVADLAVTNYVPNGGTIGQCKFDETLQSFLVRWPQAVPAPKDAPPAYKNPADIPSMPLRSYVGPFGVNTKTRLADITDGASNTLAFGETGGGQVFADGSVDFRVARVAGVVFTTLSPNPARPAALAYGSNHPAVSNFLFCDGSVRPIRKFEVLAFDNLPAAWYAFQAAAGMHDGQALAPGLFAE
jgi:prepilin-type processing-associated H-X9-DG protein